jgi:hypothetical protein
MSVSFNIFHVLSPTALSPHRHLRSRLPCPLGCAGCSGCGRPSIHHHLSSPPTGLAPAGIRTEAPRWRSYKSSVPLCRSSWRSFVPRDRRQHLQRTKTSSDLWDVVVPKSPILAKSITTTEAILWLAEPIKP